MNQRNKPQYFRWVIVISLLVSAIGGAVIWHSRSSPANSVALKNETASAIDVHSGSADMTNAVVGDPRAAALQINGVRHAILANARGEFPRLVVSASTVVVASVPFADAETGEQIMVQAEDGGRLQGEAAHGVVTLDANHCAKIGFQTPAFDGLSRLTLRRGSETRLIQLWVGAEPPVLARK